MGTSAATQGAAALPNALAAHFTNVKNRKEARVNYNRQREDALKDWEMTNEYNSPKAQMQRYREAGLNPNLMYGQMQEASPVRSTNYDQPSAQPPDIRIDNPYMAAMSASKDKSQTDLLQYQLQQEKELLEYRKKLMGAQAYNQIASAGRSDAETQEIMQRMGFEAELQPIKVSTGLVGIEHTQQEIAASKVNVTRNEKEIEKIKADTTFTLDQNKRAWQMQKGNLSEQQARIRNMDSEVLRRGIENAKTKQEILNLQYVAEGLDNENFVKELQAFRAQNGIAPGDSTPIQILSDFGAKKRGKNTTFESQRKKYPQDVNRYKATDSKQ